MRILTFTSLFPNKMQPNLAIFIKHRMNAVKCYCNIDLRVVAPVPYFPNLPFKFYSDWQTFAKIPRHEMIDDIFISHPRYLVTPKIGMTAYGYSMFLGSLREVARIHREFPFDIIDGHYIYPDGLAAILLGRVFDKPVVLSARGTDINLYPQFRLVNPLIRKAIRQSDHLISVCDSLRDIMVELGAPTDKIAVIPNGIDPKVFRPIDRVKARNLLGLIQEKKILLTVGALIERKGMHLLIEALAEINRRNCLDFYTFIIGKGEEKARLEQAIQRYSLQDKVKLVGEINNADLYKWYNAADLFFLGSSREGWPNVVSESIACGTPVVATSANGITEILFSESYGIIVHRNIQGFADGILAGFQKTWDREKIITYGQSRSWENVAKDVYRVYERVLFSQ